MELITLILLVSLFSTLFFIGFLILGSKMMDLVIYLLDRKGGNY